MAIYLDTTGKSTLGIGLCARCSRKFSLTELYSDPNSPGLMVCKDDLDDYDPYRLPARQPDMLTLPFYRPDVSIALEPPEAEETAVRITEEDEIRTTESDAYRVVE